MSEEWIDTTLGTLLTRVRRKVVVEPGVSYPAASVMKDGQGLGAKEPFVGGETNYKQLFRVHAGDVVVRTITAFESPVGVANEAHHGAHVSQVFITYQAGDSIRPSFLRYYFQTKPFWDEMQNRAQGTVLRRKTISDENFQGIPLVLPPLSVQRRIVDLMEHLDTHIERLRAEQSAAEHVLQRLVIEKFALPPSQEAGTPLHDLLTRNIGGVWGTTLGSDERDCAVYRTTEFTNLGVLTGAADAQRSITEKQYKGRALEVGDILMEKSGGTPGRPVGRVVRLSKRDLKGAAVGANFLQLLRADEEKVDPDYLFWVLWGSHRRGDSESYQRASTNIRNLKTKEYLARRVLLPPRDEQGALSECADSLQRVVLGLAQEAAGLRDLRRRLLHVLLNREREIVESYDELLGRRAS